MAVLEGGLPGRVAVEVLVGRREIEALLTTQHTSTDWPSAVLLGGHFGGAGNGRGGAARAPADAVRARLQLAGGRRERWLRHPSRIAARAKFSSSATAACLSFAGQFLSQIGSAPVSATLQVVYLGLFRPLWGFTTWSYALARTTSGGWAPPST